MAVKIDKVMETNLILFLFGTAGLLSRDLFLYSTVKSKLRKISLIAVLPGRAAVSGLP